MRHFLSSRSAAERVVLFTAGVGAAAFSVACSESPPGNLFGPLTTTGNVETSSAGGGAGARNVGGSGGSGDSSGMAGNTGGAGGGNVGAGTGGSPTGGPPTGGGGSADGGLVRSDGGDDGAAGTLAANVLQYHKNPSRNGLYVDAAFTKAAAARVHQDTTFVSAPIQGPSYAQPLYFENAAGGKNLVIVATERNLVYALDAANGSIAWQTTLGQPVALADMQCGNIDPFGVTGTPVIDAASKTLFVAALTTPNNGNTKRHQVFAISLDDGTPRAGWPVDVSTITANDATFQADVQGQRGALALLGRTVYVAYGGMLGECGDYHGWIVAIPVDGASPVATAYATTSAKSGIWGPGGIASDGTDLFVATGNAPEATDFGQQESLLRIAPGATFVNQSANYFTPSNWQNLDTDGLDLGGSGPLVVDVAGATPSKLLVALGKDGNAYLVDRTNLGGIVSNGSAFQGVHHLHVTTVPIIQAAAAYTTNTSTYVTLRGEGDACATGTGDLTTLRISAAAPPRLSSAWCAAGGGGSPIVTTTDGTSDAIVWQIATGGVSRLRGFDGDTGAVVFNGGAAADQMGAVQTFQTAIVARGRIFVAGNNAVYAFTP